MKRRPPIADDCGLPADIAAGPDPRIWGNRETGAVWRKAATEWSEANGLYRNGWLDLLSPEVRYATRALGRAHIAAGGLVPPWEQR